MANAFAPQSLIRCQLSRHGATAGIFQPKQWRASLASPNPKSLFAEENRSRLIGWSLAGALALGLSLAGPDFADAKIGVNKPALLPKEFSPVIDVAGFLSPGQEIRLVQKIAELEKNTGYKLRILAQNYPDTPGLAVKDFWHVDENTIVFVADPTFGNILHFNVGELIHANVPHNFWSRVSGKYGNMFYWKEKGEEAAIEAAVTAISKCLTEPNSTNCSEIQL
ncbi:Thylakoid lumenal 15-protein 2 [Nymphaea thermarum]|nr:Thylakoid lumenal 15-protein 2 [Nymphaea thermarum]